MKKINRVGAIIIENGKILLVRGKGFKELWIPGGKLIELESDEQCLRRELKEEIGVEIKNLKFIGEFSSPSFYSPTFTINRIYLTDVKNKPVPNNEIEEIFWLSKEDFLSKRFPMIPIIEERIIPAVISKGYF